MGLLSRRELLLGGASLALGASRLIAAGPDPSPPVVIPEYERTLESVLLAIPAGTMSYGVPDEGDGSGVAALTRFLELAFHDVLAVVPGYSTIHVVAHAQRRRLAAHVMKPAGPRALTHLVTEPGVEIELFAQDLGEPIRVAGETKFLVGLRMDPTLGEVSHMSAYRKRTAEYVFGEDAVVEAEFVFEGGNLVFDQARGNGRVLVGFGNVRRTIEHYGRRGEKLTRRDVEARMASAFGGAEIVVLGEERQSPLLQHLDQAFVLLKEGVAVMIRLSGEAARPERRQLETYRGVLRDLGYRLVFIDHQMSDLESCSLSVNAVPFVDRSEGKSRVVFPVFPGELSASAAVPSRENLRGKAARAYDVYRDVGYEPLPVRDVTHRLGGNTHCILNALT